MTRGIIRTYPLETGGVVVSLDGQWIPGTHGTVAEAEQSAALYDADMDTWTAKYPHLIKETE